MGRQSRDYARLLDLTAEIVSSYVSHQHLPREKVPVIVREVHEALVALPVQKSSKPPHAVELKPAGNPKMSIHDNFIVCLENGKRLKSLKRHLMTNYGLTPDQYRAKWGLKAVYPMWPRATPNAAHRFRQTSASAGGRAPREGSRAQRHKKQPSASH